LISLDYLQEFTEHQESINKTDGLLNALQPAHKMFVDIIKSFCSGVELAHNMRIR